MTLQEFVHRAVGIANQDRPTSVAAVSAELASEAMVSSVFYRAAKQIWKDRNRRALVMDHSIIVLTAGTGTVPTNLLMESLAEAVVSDPADATMAAKMRNVRNWAEFIRPLDPVLGYFIVIGTNDFHMTRPGTAYNPSSGMTGNVTLTAALVPPVPAAPGNAIVAPNEFVDDALILLAAALRGEWLKMVREEAAIR